MSQFDLKPIILIGMPASGKTAIAKVLARYLRFKYIDLDTVIEQQQCQIIENIFASKGEKEFRKIEAKTFLDVIKRAQPRTIISLGGGAVTSPEIMQAMADKTISIWINTAREILIERLSQQSHRPLLQGDSLEDRVEQLWMRRYPLYKKANLQIDLHHETAKDAATALAQWIKTNVKSSA